MNCLNGYLYVLEIPCVFISQETDKFARIKAKVNHCNTGHVNSLGIDTFLLLVIVLRFAKWIKVNLEPTCNLWDHNGEP